MNEFKHCAAFRNQLNRYSKHVWVFILLLILGERKPPTTEIIFTGTHLFGFIRSTFKPRS